MRDLVERLQKHFAMTFAFRGPDEVTEFYALDKTRINPLALEAASELTRLTERVRVLEAMAQDVESECTCAIAYEAKPAKYASHDDVPNGLRTGAHIKLSIIREYARAALQEPKT